MSDCFTKQVVTRRYFLSGQILKRTLILGYINIGMSLEGTLQFHFYDFGP